MDRSTRGRNLKWLLRMLKIEKKKVIRAVETEEEVFFFEMTRRQAETFGIILQKIGGIAISSRRGDLESFQRELSDIFSFGYMGKQQGLANSVSTGSILFKDEK